MTARMVSGRLVVGVDMLLLERVGGTEVRAGGVCACLQENEGEGGGKEGGSRDGELISPGFRTADEQLPKTKPEKGRTAANQSRG